MLASTALAGSAATSTAPLLASGADVEVVAANDLGDDDTMAHLLKYDTILGRSRTTVSLVDGGIQVGDTAIKS